MPVMVHLIRTVTLTWAVVFAATVAAAPYDPPDRPTIAWPSLASSRVDITVPVPIGPKDFERYKTLLTLSEPQAAFASHFFEDYKAGFAKLQSTFAPRLLEAAARIRAATGLTSANLRFEQGAIEVEAIAGMTKIDDKFMSELESILADVQKERMPRVRMHRQRGRCIEWVRTIYKSTVDLSAMVEQIPVPDGISPELESLMWEYEQALTPATVLADEQYRRTSAQKDRMLYLRFLDEQGQPLDLNDPQVRAHSREVWNQIAAILKERTELQQRIGRLNDEYLPKFMHVLPPKQAVALRAMFLASVYPNAFPDLNDPEPIFQKCLEWSSQSRDTLDLLFEAWNAYVPGYRKVCDELCKESDLWQELESLTSSTEGWREHNQTMVKLLTQRNTHARKFVEQIRRIIPPATALEHAKDFDSWIEQCDQWLQRELEQWQHPMAG